jgi:O-antigen/teichoic acid export membrane protein
MLTSAGFVGLVVYRAELLAIFGSDYTAGTGILIVLAAGQLVNSAAGPAGHLLGMTDHQYVLLANRTSMSVANVLLNYLLLTKYGVIGTAVATALVLASLNVTRILEIYVLEGMFPYDKSFLTFLPALGVATVIMYSIRSLLMTPLSYVGIPLGLTVYVVSLYGFGMQQFERNLVDQVVTRAVNIVKP